jgi:hypothetical protein
VEQDGIDASLGLALALDLLRQHQQTGELRGEIVIVQFLKTKHYQCIIQIENGQAISCSLFDEQNQSRLIDRDYLIRVDEKSGPFDWKFYPYEKAVAPPPSTQVPARFLTTAHRSTQIDSSTLKDDAIPVRLTPELHLSWLTTWPEGDITFLQQIFSLINGERTVHDIKYLMFRASPEMIEKALVFLIAMKQIEIQRARGR